MIILGLHRTVHQLATPVLYCRTCGRTRPTALDRTVTRITVFFLPLFPIRTAHRLSCTRCGTAERLTRADAERTRRAAPA